MDGDIMTDQEIREYRKTHSSIYFEDLQKDVIKTSPQIKGVYHEFLYDLVTIITPDNQFTFFEKFKRNERK